VSIERVDYGTERKNVTTRQESWYTQHPVTWSGG